MGPEGLGTGARDSPGKSQVSLLPFQFDLSTERVGILFLVMAACYALASPVWGWLADRIVS